jgi:hypothetical protein
VAIPDSRRTFEGGPPVCTCDLSVQPPKPPHTLQDGKGRCRARASQVDWTQPVETQGQMWKASPARKRKARHYQPSRDSRHMATFWGVDARPQPFQRGGQPPNLGKASPPVQAGGRHLTNLVGAQAPPCGLEMVIKYCHPLDFQKKQGGVFSSGGVGSKLNFRDGFVDSCVKTMVIKILITISRW